MNTHTLTGILQALLDQHLGLTPNYNQFAPSNFIIIIVPSGIQ